MTDDLSFCQYLLSKYNLQIQTTINWAFTRMLNSKNWYTTLFSKLCTQSSQCLVNFWWILQKYDASNCQQLGNVQLQLLLKFVALECDVLKNDNIAQLFYFIILQCAQLLWNQHYPQATSSMATSPNLFSCFLPIVLF